MKHWLCTSTKGNMDPEQSLPLLALSLWDEPQPPWSFTPAQIILNGAIIGRRGRELKHRRLYTHLSR